MQWFWEPVHYKKALGDIMVSRMFAASEHDFGAELTSSSIDQRLADGRSERAIYRQRVPQEIENIERIVREAVERRNQLLKRKQPFRQPTVGG